MDERRYRRLLDDATAPDAPLATIVELLRAAQRRADREGMTACLDALLRAWASTPYPTLGLVVRELGEALESPVAASLREAAAGKGGKLRKVPQDDFVRAMEQASVADRGAILDLLTTGTIKEVCARARAVAAWPPDPRVTRAYRDWLAAPPFGSLSGKPFWKAGFDALISSGDPTAEDALPTIDDPAKNPFRGIGDSMREWLEANVAKTAAQVAGRTPPPTDAAADEAIGALRHLLQAGVAAPEAPDEAAWEASEEARIAAELEAAIAGLGQITERNWDALCAALDQLDESAIDDALLDRIEAALEGWPRAMRRAEPVWIGNHFRKSKPSYTRKMKIVRSLDLADAPRQIAASSIPKGLGHPTVAGITELSLTSGHWTEAVAEALVARPTIASVVSRLRPETLDLVERHGLLDRFPEVIDYPWLDAHAPERAALVARMRELRMQIPQASDDVALRDWFATADLPRLEALFLDACRYGEAFVVAVAKNPRLVGLRRIALDYVPTQSMIDALASSPHVGRLTEVALGPQHHGETIDLSGLLAGLHDSVERLSLYRPSRNELLALAAAPQLRTLEVAALPDEAIAPDELAALLASLPRLRRLSLRKPWKGFALGDEHVSAIVAGAPQLTDLVLVQNKVTEAGARIIGEAPWQLQALDLGNNAIGDEGLAALVAGGLPATLRELRLRNCGLKSKSGRTLADAPFAHLVWLGLPWNAINKKAALAIAESAWIGRLYRGRKVEGRGDLWPLDLTSNPIGSAGRAALEAKVRHGLAPKRS